MSLTEPELSMKWIYDFIADEWKDLMPEDALTSLRNLGYFTMKIQPSGLRIISLNTNVINTMNLFVYSYEMMIPLIITVYSTLAGCFMKRNHCTNNCYG